MAERFGDPPSDAEWIRTLEAELNEVKGRLADLRARFAWAPLPHHVVLPMDPEIVLSLAADVEKGGRVEIAHELRKAVSDHAAGEQDKARRDA